ncbi:hypothetical protein B0H15DRAFT_784575, partial [Mycena belliarum]
LDELLDADDKVSTPFPDSVFTTCKISFCDAPSVAEKNEDAACETMEAVTIIGNYDHTKRGQFVSWEDGKIVQVRSGSTVLFPAGTKRYSFLAVAPNETRYLFRQYCNAGVLRWIEKGGRSDQEWEDSVPPEELATLKEMRAALGAASIKSFSKISDIFVL